jgi:molybdopterin-binding protein
VVRQRRLRRISVLGGRCYIGVYSFQQDQQGADSWRLRQTHSFSLTTASRSFSSWRLSGWQCQFIERRIAVKISARNALKGKVKSVMHGAVNSEIVVELPGGQEIVSVITKTSAENLALEPGKEVCAVIKASNVMLAVDG